MHTSVRKELPATTDLGLRTRWLNATCGARNHYAADMAQPWIVIAIFTHVEHSLRLLLGEMAMLWVDIIILRALTATWPLFTIIYRRNVACRSLSANGDGIVSIHQQLLVKLRFVLTPKELLVKTILRDVLHLEVLSSNLFGALCCSVTACRSPNRVALVLTGSLAIVAFFLNYKLILSPLLLVNFHGHLTLSAPTSALVMMVVQLLVAHAIVTAMIIGEPTS